MSKLPVLVVAVSLALVACGGGQARPLPPEEPMDHSGDSTASASSTSSSTSTTSASDNSADPSAAFSGVDPSAMNAATPTPTPDPTPAPDPKGKGGKGKKGKGGDDASAGGGGGGGGLSQSECSALSDKGVELFAASMGITDPSMTAQLKATAAGDPNFSKMQGECTKSTTRAQYKCGMAAKSKDAWEACLK